MLCFHLHDLVNKTIKNNNFKYTYLPKNRFEKVTNLLSHFIDWFSVFTGLAMIILKRSSNSLGVGILFTYLQNLLCTFGSRLILGPALHGSLVGALFFDAFPGLLCPSGTVVDSIGIGILFC